MKNERKTQEEMILAYLMTGKSLTPLQALDMFGCFRLPARIYDISLKDIKIKSEFIKLENGKRVKRYWI
jgi:hypothetical protein